jgi:hypothetical protein
MTGIDRRDFVKKAGLGAAGAGALWVAPSVIGYNTAFAGTSCHQEDTFDWSVTPPAGIGATFPMSKPYGAVGSYPAVTFNASIAPVNGPGAGNNPSQQVVNNTFGGFTGDFYKLSMTNTSNTQGYDVTFTWTTTIYNLRFTVVDIDRFQDGNSQSTKGFQDRVWLTGPASWTSMRGSEIGGVAGNAGDPWVGTGTTDVGATSPNGNVAVTANPAAGLTGVVIHYRAGDLLRDVQSIGILNLKWCR